MNYHELSSHEILDRDYSIKLIERTGKSIVIAPHGGRIEPCTSKIANAIAASDISLYLFEGLKSGLNHKLHIKSTNFDEPLLANFLKSCDFSLTIHGLKDKNSLVYVGGLHPTYKEKIQRSLGKSGFNAVIDTTNHSGSDINNICNGNRKMKGVQLEVTRGLRDKMSMDDHCLESFANSVRTSIKDII